MSLTEQDLKALAATSRLTCDPVECDPDHTTEAFTKTVEAIVARHITAVPSGAWTASDHQRGLTAALKARDETAYATLSRHGIHADHCGGYEALAWPCPAAAKVLDRLLGGVA